MGKVKVEELRLRISHSSMYTLIVGLTLKHFKRNTLKLRLLI